MIVCVYARVCDILCVCVRACVRVSAYTHSPIACQGVVHSTDIQV